MWLSAAVLAVLPVARRRRVFVACLQREEVTPAHCVSLPFADLLAAPPAIGILYRSLRPRLEGLCLCSTVYEPVPDWVKRLPIHLVPPRLARTHGCSASAVSIPRGFASVATILASTICEVGHLGVKKKYYH